MGSMSSRSFWPATFYEERDLHTLDIVRHAKGILGGQRNYSFMRVHCRSRFLHWATTVCVQLKHWRHFKTDMSILMKPCLCIVTARAKFCPINVFIDLVSSVLTSQVIKASLMGHSSRWVGGLLGHSKRASQGRSVIYQHMVIKALRGSMPISVLGYLHLQY